MSRVLKHVDQRRAHLARRAQRAGVVAVAEDTTGATQKPVERSRDAHEQSLHAARERAPVGGLDDQVQVVRLDRMVNQAQAEALAAARECALEDSARGVATQARQPGVQAGGHMNRVPSRKLRPRAM
jgi:phage protein D